MLTNIISFSVRNKLIIGLLTLGLIGYGAYQTTRLPIDAVPDITNNQVQVITFAPSFGATDIERLVTFPIEQANSNISGLIEMRSFSRFGLSLVTLVFSDDTDVYWARQQVTERLQQVQAEIPAGIGTPSLGPITTGLGEIYQYVVKPKKGYENRYDATSLRTIQDWIIRRQLLGVKGVADVSSFGGKLKQHEIAVNPNKLNALGLTISDVFDAIEMNNENTGGAYIEKGATVLYIRSEGLIGSPADIEAISIGKTDRSVPIFLRDVAEVKTGHATRFGAMCYNDEGEVAGAVVMMLKGANSSEVIKNVKDRIKQIETTLPEGVEIEPFLDRTKMVNNAITTVEKNLLEGALIVVFVLVVFLGNFRAGLLVASVIPLSMLFAISMMNAFGVSGNLMSLGALDFGLIVDGAVIIVEAVMHQLARRKSPLASGNLVSKAMDTEVIGSASKMMNSAVFGQIIILIVYLPIFALQGIEGKMFKPMAQTVAFALLGAFILSLTYIPMMSALILSRKQSSSKNLSDRLMERLNHVYQKGLRKALRTPVIVLSAAAIAFGLSIFVLSRMGGEFIPALEEGDFAVDTRVLTGSNLQTTIQSTQKAAGLLKKNFPEVEKVVTKIGSGEIPTDPMPMEAADMMVILKDKREWTSARTFDELAEKMSKVLEDVPGITAGFQYPVQMRFNELMTGARQDVVCKIFGENMDTLAVLADRLARLAAEVEGAEDLYVEPVTGIPQILIEYNRPLLAQYQLSIVQVNKIINTAFAGQSAGQVFEGEKRFDVVVKLDQEVRSSLEDVRQLLIPTPGGTQVPLHQVADVQIKDGPNQIQREDAKRRIVVGFNVQGRDVQSIVQELQEEAKEKLQMPVGYYVTYGGAFENLNRAKARLAIAVPIALLLIFVLLYFAFRSVRQGLLIYTAIPLSAIGGVFLLALRGMPFSISAGIGFIALFGVAVLNGIVLIAEFNRMKQKGIRNMAMIVTRGTGMRLRPVLMTAMVASLGFLPMALSSGAGAEVQRPLATVVIGGLMVATFLTLFVLPILYVLFEKRSTRTMNLSALPTLLLLLAGGLLSTGNTTAQTPIRLQAAIDTALHNNLSLKNEVLVAEYEALLRAAAVDIPVTRVALEYGQINSAYRDSKWTLGQTCAFPTVYTRQKKVQKAQWEGSLIGVKWEEARLKKEVSQAFYQILYLQGKQQILEETDSLFAVFLEKSNLRFQQGETQVLEKINAETQRGQIAWQLTQVKADLAVWQLRFRFLLNSPQNWQPVAESSVLLFPVSSDPALVVTHPELRLLAQQGHMARAGTQWEKSKLLPELQLAYSNHSIQGVGADERFYTRGTRFQSFELGLGVPLYYKAQRARIDAAKTREQIAENGYQQGKWRLETEYQSRYVQYQAQTQAVRYFEETGLPNADLQVSAANEQLSRGTIDYLGWTLLIQQATLLRSQYADALNDLNQTIIEIQYLTNN
jgi:heavy metal efflux system protein